MKVPRKRFRLSGNTIGFHPRTQHLELLTKQIAPCEKTVEEVLLEWHTVGFHLPTKSWNDEQNK